MRRLAQAARWSPRENLPGQFDLIPTLDILAIEAARFAPRGNGGPAPNQDPSYETLARIGRALYGPLWEGKLAPALQQDPSTLRRWRDGEGVPNEGTMRMAHAQALQLVYQVLIAASEPDLAEPIRDRLNRIHREAREHGRAKFLAAMAAQEADAALEL